MRVATKQRLAITFVLSALIAPCLLPAPWAAAGEWTRRSAEGNRQVLTAKDLGKLPKAEEVDRRGKIVLRRIRPADGNIDWNTDPTAIPYVLYQFEQRTGLPTYVNNEALNVATDELFEYPLVYLTGHAGWQFNQAELDNLTKFLQRGATILLDDCYIRRSPFTDSAGAETSKLLPGSFLRPAVPTDPYVSDLFRLCYNFPPNQWPGGNPKYWNNWQYALWDGCPAIYFTPNDDGCFWEVSSPPTASNPIGEAISHAGPNEFREVCYQWITDWFLFALTH